MEIQYENKFIVAGKLNKDPQQYWDIYARNEKLMQDQLQKDWQKKTKTQDPMQKDDLEKLIKTFDEIQNMHSSLHCLLQNYIYKKEFMELDVDHIPEYKKWDSERDLRLEKYYCEQPELINAWYTFIFKKIKDSKVIKRLNDNEGEWRQFVQKQYDEEYCPDLQPQVLLDTLTEQIEICEEKLDSAFVLEYNDVQLLWKAMRQLSSKLWVKPDSDGEDDYEYDDEDDYEDDYKDTHGANILNLTNSSNNPYVLNFAF